MQSIAPSKTSSSQRPTFNSQLGRRVLLFWILFGFGFASSPPLNAQVGNDNPSGPAGIFNGNLEVGVDPYTGNAGPRSTVDISIAGAVTPLALVRTYNSRDGIGTHFGYSGWRHSYEWSIDPSGTIPIQDMAPAAYVVNFPDGRREIFRFVSWDCDPNPPYTCYYRVCGYRCGPDTSAGVRDRFQQIDPAHNNFLGSLIMPDGSEVEFLATRHPTQGGWYYTYRAQAIIDPYKLRTTISWSGGQISRVTEPAGRYIDFHYRTDSPQIIKDITGSDGRVVKYTYSNSAYPPGTSRYLELDNVTYYVDRNPLNSQWTAKYKYKAPNDANNTNGIPLLWTADEPIYTGAMKRICYEYKTGTNPDGSQVTYGQIYKVRYWDGTTQNAGNGVVVSTLDVTAFNTRKETRGDSKWRTFTYGARDTQFSGHLLSCTDFTTNHVSALQSYDPDTLYINSVTDRNGHRTDYTLDSLTGNVTQVQFPAINTPSPAPRGTLSYTYGSPGCHDSNNRDDRSPYYPCTATDEAGHVTKFSRYPDKRPKKIEYPDGGWEEFTYDSAHKYQVSTHRMTTGGTESWAYDGLYRKQYYSDAYHNNNGNPSIQYFYDPLDRVNEIHDALGHPTNYEYNDRGQLTKTTDGQQHTVVSDYYPDGTLKTKTDELSHVTTYTYDDYRRVKSVKTPRDQANNLYYTTNFYYDAGGSGDDYKYIDSNITWAVLPSGKKTNTHYDDNRRKDYVIVASGLPEAAKTSYEYDPVGNVRKITAPEQQATGQSTLTDYDERNRPWQITDPLNYQTKIFYDAAGRKKKVVRPNNQEIRYDTFDNMNRVTQQTVFQDPNLPAITQYEYHPSGPAGLLHTMKDPRLVAFNSAEKYEYLYDAMGRKQWVFYPLDSNSPPARTVEYFGYDNAGRLQTYFNRNAKTQTFDYDALNRIKDFYWDDGITPRVDFAYDAASRLTDINNPNATIHREYWDDNLLKSETENITLTGGTSKTLNYVYNADGGRATLTYPGAAYSITYDYTGRNQVWKSRAVILHWQPTVTTRTEI